MIKRVLITLKSYKYYSLASNSFAIILRKKPVSFCIILIIVLVYKFSVNDFRQFNYFDDSESEIIEVTSLEQHNLTIAEYFGARNHWNTSNLGTLLFKNQNNSFQQKDKTFVVLVWKYFNWLKGRHVNNYGREVRHEDLLKDCSVNNCVFTGSGERIDTADAVVVHIQHGKYPNVTNRNEKQIWIFLSDESPRNAFSLIESKVDIQKWANVFNWSMTYKSNADVPVPYGRTVPLQEPIRIRVTYEAIAELIPKLQFKRTDVLVAVLISNCGIKYRTKFIEALQKYIKVDVYGGCGTGGKKKQCLGHFKKNCPLLDQYYFYLVMENSMCKQYITEKTFHNAYSKGAIPVLVGTYLKDSQRLLPPNSFIHFDDYNTVEKLAIKINSTIQNIREYLSYHLWRNHFEVKNEHGYFGTKSYHLCRVCEALNFNEEKQSVYSFKDLRHFLDPNDLCQDVKVPST